MNIIEIEGKLINVDKIHFVRKVSKNKLLISFGSDYVDFTGAAEKLEEIINEIQRCNEKLSDYDRRKRVLD